jgi:hypothetical protein
MPTSDARTVALEAQVRRAREDARRGEFDAEALAELFRKGTDGQRIYALAALQEHPDLATADLLLDALRTSRSRFEQYHTLVLADLAEPELMPQERKALKSILTEQLGSEKMPRDGDRGRIASRLLERLTSQ